MAHPGPNLSNHNFILRASRVEVFQHAGLQGTHGQQGCRRHAASESALFRALRKHVTQVRALAAMTARVPSCRHAGKEPLAVCAQAADKHLNCERAAAFMLHRTGRADGARQAVG